MKHLVINVSGFIFQVTEQCLERYPDTLLGNNERRMNYYNNNEEQFFFNRHRLAFEGVLMYYQSYGRVMCPPNVPEEVFQSELKFFEIQCAYLEQMEEAKGFVVTTMPNPKDLSQLPLKQRIWEIMHNPASSVGAQILSTFSMCVTMVSIGLSCLHQEPKPDQVKIRADTFPLETACFIWFTLEFLLRLFTCPEKMKLLKSWIDITDLGTLLIFYFSLALSSTQSSSTSVLRIFRLANAFRVFRLTRFSNGLRLLIYTIYTSRTDLQLLSSFMAFFILISGSCVYFADISDPESKFNEDGIFSGFWFSLISCTTVGYGDITPITGLGKFVAALTITFGAMFILLPVLKLVSAFSDALQATRSLLEKREEEKQEKQEKQEMQ